jgi:hypothetical protein
MTANYRKTPVSYQNRVLFVPASPNSNNSSSPNTNGQHCIKINLITVDCISIHNEIPPQFPNTIHYFYYTYIFQHFFIYISKSKIFPIFFFFFSTMPYTYTLTYCNYFHNLILLATAFSLQLHTKTQSLSSITIFQTSEKH